MARTKTSSIIKTRSQSRTDSRTIAPAPVTGRSTTGTIDSVDPVAVTTGRTIDVAPAPVDLFAGRPTTSTLKDPPPVPRDRNLDSDSDDAKKPAAKPKAKPKKVAPKARKPHNVDLNELVDPMSRVHVDDATGVVTAGGGIARAGGLDPVLANSLMNPNPRRSHVAQWTDALAHLARIAPATVMMTMMRTPTAP